MSTTEKQWDLGLINRDFADLNPVSFGWEACRPGHAFGPAIRRYTLIHYVIKGQGVLEARGSRFPVRENEAFLIRPDEVTRYQADRDQPWEYLWIGFTGRLSAAFQTMPAVLRPDRHLMTGMLDARALTDTRELFLAGRLFALLSDLTESHRSVDRVREARNYLDQNYMHPVRLETLAASLGLDRRYLSRLFKQQTGNTMQQYLTDRRMEEAARLLRQGYPVATAGQMAGYDDPFRFSKAFRQYYGLSPRRWLTEQD